MAEKVDRFKKSKFIQKAVPVILLLCVMTIGIKLRLNYLSVSERTPDEKIYTFYAKNIVQGGVRNISALIQSYNLNKDMWIYPTPIRIGYIYLISISMKIMNSTDVRVAAYVSCIFSIISLLLLVLIGLRFFNTWITVFSLLFMSVSPMDLAIARRAWQDSILACFGLLLIYFCCEISINPRRKIFYFLLWVFGVYCLLIKESAIIIYGLCTLWLLWVMLFREKSLKKSLFLIISSFIGVIVCVLFLAKVSGGITPVIEVVKNSMRSLPTNEYVTLYQTGPWYYFLQGFWTLVPFATVLVFMGIAGVVLSDYLFKSVLILDNKKRIVYLGITFFILAYIFIATVPPYYKNLRFLSPVFALFYLMSGIGFWYIYSLIKHRMKKFFLPIAGLIILITSLAAFNDYKSFKYIFIKNKAPDLVNKLFAHQEK